MDRKAAVSGVILLLLAASLIATELARPQSPLELSGDATRGSREGTRTATPKIAQPTIVLERPPTCTDGLRNGVESGVDCGGPVCPACAVGKSCVRNEDCASSRCDEGLCKEPLCTDVIRNGVETDVDCGGSCPACVTGKLCLVNKDCDSKVCAGGVCTASSCTDTFQNGQETDVDCGGPSCPACASCTDGLKNGAETGVDCGGSCKSKCSNGAACLIASDCTSNVCQNNMCVAPCLPDWGSYGSCSVSTCGQTGTKSRSDGCGNTETLSCSTPACPTCYDRIKNGPETDVDCGGSCLAKCADGKMCGISSDCSSGVCTNNQCAAACVPQWRNDGSCTASCGQTGNYQRQIDGCGNSRMVSCSGPACPTCSETDGGLNSGVRGTTTGYVKTSSGKSAYPIGRSDYCKSSSVLIEYYCLFGEGPGAEMLNVETQIACPCRNGRCVY